jgi:uncharacterized protein
MTKCFFVSDLHGKKHRFLSLIEKIREEKPNIVFFGGDISPPFNLSHIEYKGDFFDSFFIPLFKNLKVEMGNLYPKIYIIPGNDDPASIENDLLYVAEKEDLWEYLHLKKSRYNEYNIFGYAFIPPTPFIHKDWEVYDVSRYADPGCIHPTEGKRSVEKDFDVEFTTISNQLQMLTEDEDLEKSVFLFHSPPYKTKLDRAALDNMFFEHVPLDVHVGSIAIKDFIESKSPPITLHGHIHESTRLTGDWKEKINNTWCFNAATDENELCLIIFELENPDNATMLLL